jgi:nitrite reductase/ring-hydroxylating ferredoxin subunit
MADTWIPLALSTSIEPATSAGAIVDGVELVVWRDSKGVAHVWEDRCPHRGMRLSFGFVRGDHIACLYHGWQYDTGGQCRHIPAHPELEVPATIKVQTYAAAERDGLIWTRLTDGADEADIPVLEGATPVRSLYADCSMAAAEALLQQARFADSAMTVTAIGANCWKLSGGTATVFVAGQSLNASKIALHILAASGTEPAAKKAIIRWAEGLRLGLEDKAQAGAMAEFA